MRSRDLFVGLEMVIVVSVVFSDDLVSVKVEGFETIGRVKICVV